MVGVGVGVNGGGEGVLAGGLALAVGIVRIGASFRTLAVPVD